MRIVNNPDIFRKNISNNLHSKMKNLVTETIKPSISINIEKGIYNYAIDLATSRKLVKKWVNAAFVNLYISKLRSVYFNLDKDLVLKILNKEIKSHEIAFLKHEEIKPDKWMLLLEKKRLKDENMYTTQIEATTDAYTCRKCNSKKCWHFQLQTRSGDEAMTTYVTCLDCNTRWKC